MNPRPRKGILEQLAKDAKKYAGSKVPIFLSFTSDPYQPLEETEGLTRKAIEILTENGCAINVLTKGGLRAARDFLILQLNPLNWFGVTLTDSLSSSQEPNAATPFDRITALYRAKHNYGLNTWISFEPILSPSAVLGMIRATMSYCDLYKIGKLNHRSDMGPTEAELRKFLKEAVELLESNGKEYYIKLDTRPFLLRG